jgi:serine-type D-Ala-D-Ala carboxypeptidase (penicillin-binding protein 5/6)
MRKQTSVRSSQIVSVPCILFYCIMLLTAYLFFPVSVCAEDLRSRAVVVMEASTGKTLYAKNPNLKRPPASTTKLMTAILALENTNLQDVVVISSEVAATPPHKAGFREGEKVTVEQLLYAALLGSANDAAVALAEAVSGSEGRFVELMNRKAIAVGALNTRFINANGLPGPGQYTTASDLAKIMSYALRYPKLKDIIGTKTAEVTTERGRTFFVKNTNRLLWSEEDLVGGKTGYTRSARHCFVCAAERDNDTIIVALLGSPSRETLWSESERLISKGFDVVENRDEPRIYFTKAEYDDDDIIVRKAIYKKNSRKTIKNSTKKKSNKILIAKKKAKKKTCSERAINQKEQKKTVVAKKKTNTKTKTFAKKKVQKKNYKVAEKKKSERIKG